MLVFLRNDAFFERVFLEMLVYRPEHAKLEWRYVLYIIKVVWTSNTNISRKALSKKASFLRKTHIKERYIT